MMKIFKLVVLMIIKVKMLDSLDDHGGSMHISSFGEASHNSLEVMQTQTYKLTIDFLNSD